MASLMMMSFRLFCSFAEFLTISRSVTMPTSEPRSMTRSAPMLHSAICLAAACRVSVLLMLKHSRPFMLSSSLTFMATPVRKTFTAFPAASRGLPYYAAG